MWADVITEERSLRPLGYRILVCWLPNFHWPTKIALQNKYTLTAPRVACPAAPTHYAKIDAFSVMLFINSYASVHPFVLVRSMQIFMHPGCNGKAGWWALECLCSIFVFSSFRIDASSDNYRLHVSGYSGNATGQGLTYNNGHPFSTRDADHDGWDRNCATHSSNGNGANSGGWWYKSCSYSFLNSMFNSVGWYGKKLRFTEMKIRESA